MSWTTEQTAHYEAEKLAGKLRTAAKKLKNIGRRCHLCEGGGERFEMDGWAAPAWELCTWCGGTGVDPDERSNA